MSQNQGFKRAAKAFSLWKGPLNSSVISKLGAHRNSMGFVKTVGSMFAAPRKSRTWRQQTSAGQSHSSCLPDSLLSKHYPATSCLRDQSREATSDYCIQPVLSSENTSQMHTDAHAPSGVSLQGSIQSQDLSRFLICTQWLEVEQSL